MSGSGAYVTLSGAYCSHDTSHKRIRPSQSPSLSWNCNSMSGIHDSRDHSTLLDFSTMFEQLIDFDQSSSARDRLGVAVSNNLDEQVLHMDYSAEHALGSISTTKQSSTPDLGSHVQKRPLRSPSRVPDWVRRRKRFRTAFRWIAASANPVCDSQTSDVDCLAIEADPSTE